MGLFFEIMTAALGVFGLWCLLRLCAEALFASRRITSAILLCEREDAEELGALISQSRAMLSYRRGCRVAILCNKALLEDAALLERVRTLCARYGAELWTGEVYLKE